MSPWRAARPCASSFVVGQAHARGTCGELVQGVLRTGEHFHVTCPILRRASVLVHVRPASELRVEGLPQGKDKLARALAATARFLGTGPVSIEASTRSALAVGKGMGSSTADVVAGARALALAYGVHLTPAELARIATSIELSDGSMYEGIVAFCRRTGELVRRYAWYPRFALAIAIPPNSVRTESVDFTGKARFARHFEDLLSVLDEAERAHDPFGFAHAATCSAIYNQPFLANELFAHLRRQQARLGAAGLVIGHTGTLAGLLYPLDEAGASAEADALERARFAASSLAAKLPSVQVVVTLTPQRAS
jgi:L-threonine kinase